MTAQPGCQPQYVRKQADGHLVVQEVGREV